MRFLLDTNIISNVIKPIPPEALLAWMAGQTDDDLFITSLTVAEIYRGVLEKPAGRRRTNLNAGSSDPKVRAPCSPVASFPSTRRRLFPGQASWRMARRVAGREARSMRSSPPSRLRTAAWS